MGAQKRSAHRKRARLRGVAVLAVLVAASTLAFPVFGLSSADRPVLLDVLFLLSLAALTASAVVFFWRTLNPLEDSLDSEDELHAWR